MSDMTRMFFDDGSVIVFELAAEDDASGSRSREGGLVPASRLTRDSSAKARQDVMEETAASLSKSLETVTRFTRELRTALEHASPERVQVEFGFAMGAEGGVPHIVKGEASCHVKVRLSWGAGIEGNASDREEISAEDEPFHDHDDLLGEEIERDDD